MPLLGNVCEKKVFERQVRDSKAKGRKGKTKSLFLETEK
jgi:hypothetical protein